MDLLAFIRIADPTKVRDAERQCMKDEPRVLESTVGRIVPLLPIAHAHTSSELEASVDRLFDEGANGDGQDADVQPVAVTTNTIAEDVAPLQPRRQRKRKTAVVDAGGPSHPPKKLREDFGPLGGVSTAKKSMVVVQSLFPRAMLEAEARGEPVPTLPFVTSSVSATPERKDRSPANSISLYAEVRMRAEYNIRENRKLRAVVDEQAELLKTKDTEIESLKAQLLLKDAEAAEAIRLWAEVFKLESVEQSLRGEVGFLRDQNTALEREKNELNVKVTDLPASVKVREQEVADLDAQVTAIKLKNDNLVGQISLYAEVRMRAEYNIREKRKLRAVVDEQAELLKTKDTEIESLKAQLLLKEAEAAEAIRLWAEVFKLESVEQSLRALGAAISKTVEKGMQEGLSAGITHGAEGRKLVDVAVYNPSEEADSLSALQHLQSVNFSLISKLKSNKDA
nr:hypothetical protein [Tanacetum cinerariifolium]